jgi:hypothetical protein
MLSSKIAYFYVESRTTATDKLVFDHLKSEFLETIHLNIITALRLAVDQKDPIHDPQKTDGY